MSEIISWLLFIIFIAGLILVGCYLVHDYLKSDRNDGGSRSRLFSGRADKRLGVVEQESIDGRRRLVLIRRDNVEHLIMTGGPVDVVIETGVGDTARAKTESVLTNRFGEPNGRRRTAAAPVSAPVYEPAPTPAAPVSAPAAQVSAPAPPATHAAPSDATATVQNAQYASPSHDQTTEHTPTPTDAPLYATANFGDASLATAETRQAEAAEVDHPSSEPLSSGRPATLQRPARKLS